jgi:hypothetical protein
VKQIAAIAVLLLVGLAAAPSAGAIEPGSDLFQTDPAGTTFSFREEFTIPANFFDQGSEPFAGDVSFAGVPLLTFQGKDVGDADTVVQRKQAMTFTPPFPARASAQIELVQLSLASVEPIQVRVGGATQLWDVRATQSPSRPSTGQIDVTQTGELGGTYSSQLLVNPKFDFTRLSDGATRTLDVGSLQLGEGARKLIFSSENIPWRAGCAPPALDVPGLNPGFCPGLTPEAKPTKALGNVEQSALARHKVFPAQRRLEHFSCYLTQSPTVKPLALRLSDQFGDLSVKLRARGSLCAPAQKNREPWENRRAHLQCYTITPKPVRRPVAVRNQFGSVRLVTVAAKQLCAPASKAPAGRRLTPLDPVDQIDHFTCYSVRTVTVRLPRVSLKDQFGTRRFLPAQINQLCVPTAKNGEPVQHAVEHLVCYSQRASADFGAQRVHTRDQFGSRTVVVQAPGMLCVPSSKKPL